MRENAQSAVSRARGTVGNKTGGGGGWWNGRYYGGGRRKVGVKDAQCPVPVLRPPEGEPGARSQVGVGRLRKAMQGQEFKRTVEPPRPAPACLSLPEPPACACRPDAVPSRRVKRLRNWRRRAVFHGSD